MEQDWSNKLLVNTYAANNDEQTARFYLNRIPQNTTENVEFHQLFNAVHQGEINTVQQIAAQKTSVNAGIAQSILSEWRGDIYNRTATPILSQNSKALLDKAESMAIDFQLYPNPSNLFVKIVFDSNNNEGKRNLKLFNLEGQEVGHHEVVSNQSIDVQELKTGMYYVQLEGFTALVKLLIIH